MQYVYWVILGLLITLGCRGSVAHQALASECQTNAASSGTPAESGALTSKTVILKVGGAPVAWPEFRFWLKFIANYYAGRHHLQKIRDWNVTENGMPLRQFLLTCAVGYAAKERAIEAKTAELGLQLAEADRAAIAAQREKNRQIYGTLEYQRLIARMYQSETVYDYLLRMDYLTAALFQHYYGAGGEQCSDREVMAYVKQKGLIRVKTIFVATTDEQGKDLSPEARTTKYAQLQRLLRQLKVSRDPLALFEALWGEVNEDPLATSYPEGRLVVPGELGRQTQKALLRLAENHYSGIVQESNGYAILLRLPVSPAMIVDAAGNSLRYWVAHEVLFKNQVEAWAAQLPITYTDAYSQIDVAGVLEW